MSFIIEKVFMKIQSNCFTSEGGIVDTFIFPAFTHPCKYLQLDICKICIHNF